MPDRLSALDASFLYLETVTTPMHVGGVFVFEVPESGFDYDRLLRLIEQRISLVPRYRQRVVQVPGRLARPVWVDDADFDLAYHVRRSALPKPGSERQLTDLVARLLARQLDHSRPLWEIYLVEGLADNQVAVITKTHQAMVDGTKAIDIGQVLLDDDPNVAPVLHDLWRPEPAPNFTQLVLDAVGETVSDVFQRPGELVENVQAVAADVTGTLRKVGSVVGEVAAMARTAARPAPGSPLNERVTRHRRFGVVRTKLADYRAVRAQHGGTVNDVVLATLAGALRTWLLARGEVVTSSSTVRALIPVSVRDELAPADADAVSGLLPVGNSVTGYLVDLPVGEPNAVVRLHHISHAMRAHADSGRSVGAEHLVALSGFAPTTLHALGARAAGSFAKRIFNIVVTNVPGPQVPLYAAGAKLAEMFPVIPLARNQALAVGVTSYLGGVYCGFNADRDAMPDVDVLVAALAESLDELVGTVQV